MIEEQMIDIEDLPCQEVKVYKDGGDVYVNLINVDIGDLIDCIGENTILEYLGVKEYDF